MKVLIIACSIQAYRLMESLKEKWNDTEIICKVKCSALGEISEKESIYEIVEQYFNKVDAIVFISAVGIAVRSIAPCIVHKSTDPAVVVIDEKGKYCISLLSGHYGGGNELAVKLGGFINALPVITTATDLENKFAVDVFAARNNLKITDWKKAKEISAKILECKKIGIYSDIDLAGNMPDELFLCDKEKAEIIISHKKEKHNGLWLIPKNIFLGIGCKKNTSLKKITSAIDRCLSEMGIAKESLYSLASIDLKKNEKGIREYCKNTDITFVTYSAEELKKVKGSFTSSDFVEEITGVDNVCERSALALSGGELISAKKVYDGVTIAIALKKGEVYFE